MKQEDRTNRPESVELSEEVVQAALDRLEEAERRKKKPRFGSGEIRMLPIGRAGLGLLTFLAAIAISWAAWVSVTLIDIKAQLAVGSRATAADVLPLAEGMLNRHEAETDQGKAGFQPRDWEAIEEVRDRLKRRLAGEE